MSHVTRATPLAAYRNIDAPVDSSEASVARLADLSREFSPDIGFVIHQSLESVEAEWRRFQRYNRTLSMLLIDIDEFKRINDRFGHEAGDEALKAVAKACMEDKRSTDIVARVGAAVVRSAALATKTPGDCQ